MEASLQVRLARPDEVAYIVDLIDRVQQNLIKTGSLQVIGPISHERVSGYVAAETAFVLEDKGHLLGSVFVSPITAESCPELVRWQLAEVIARPWFLRTLALEPGQQGRGLGLQLLAALKKLLARSDPHATIILDCWAGNSNLRTFYTRAGFKLHGVFPVHDYSVAVFTSAVV
ncbi:GNAT family N-acetyltransferase [Dictyobacter formicarum]|uniref:N-acetyltransferase domain-containing protein n=1 Tax=Dictyobacter formicarum TaxID=2778368 RepID=A0ABQ3VDN6_9CHLR|nr:GNAT family N-acetyltransferase [Dictyobacter formicarum]GHO83606.1 hypothetical protein KSZ_16120 [Dictyobacter formicarum]